MSKAVWWLERQLRDMNARETRWFTVLIAILGVTIGVTAAIWLPGWALIVFGGLCLLGVYACVLKIRTYRR